MKCSECDTEFFPADIKEKKQGLIAPLVRCPNCTVWLRKDRKSSSLQMVGILVCFAGFAGAADYFHFDYFLGMAMMSAGFMMFLAGFKVSKWTAQARE